MGPDDLELLTVVELARFAKVHRSTIYQAIKDERINAVRLGPRTIRVSVGEARRFLDGKSRPE